MKDEHHINRMEKLLESDAEDETLFQYLIELRQLGVTQQDARRMLTILLDKYRTVNPPTKRSELLDDKVCDMLDCVMGNTGNSEYWVYPEN